MTPLVCNGCTACCANARDKVPVGSDDPSEYITQTVPFVDGRPIRILAKQASGACIYLGARGCTIYEMRPRVCRVYDCRKHFLSLSKSERVDRTFLAPSVKRAAKRQLGLT